MAALALSSLELGPAKYTLGALATIASKSGATLTESLDEFKVEGELSGYVHTRRLGIKAELTFTPDNQITSGIISALWPYIGASPSKKPGDSCFSSSAATALVAATMDGKTHTIADAAVTSMPDLNFAPNKDLIGNVTYTGRIAYSVAPPGAGALVTHGTAVWSAPTFASADFITGTPTLTLKSSADATLWSSESDDGWTVSFPMRTQEIRAAGRLRDIRYLGHEVIVRGIPVDAVPADLLSEFEGGTDVTTGDAYRATPYHLILTMGTTPSLLTLDIPLAAPMDLTTRYAADSVRVGEVGFHAIKAMNTHKMVTLAIS
jgi:hypothetical protein